MKRRDWKGEIPDAIKFDILKRLPAKSLMRFKCVCKTWRAIIEDRSFAEQHHVESKIRRDASYILLFCNDCEQKEITIIPVNKSDVSTTDIAGLKFAEYVLCTDVVEGLACVRDNKGTLSALNVTTGEKLCLPRGVKMRDDRFASYSYPRYFLGFDPLNKNYKLLQFRLGIKFCRILTLGESSWREIDSLGDKPLTPDDESIRRHKCVSVNGAIYWILGHSVIKYFDVHTEKFMRLDLPHGVGRISQLARVGDSLGLLCTGTQWPVLWTLSPTKVWKMQEMAILNWKWIEEYVIIGTNRTAGLLWNLKDGSSTGVTSTEAFIELRFTSKDPTSNSKGNILIEITHPWFDSDLCLFGATCDHFENILSLKALSCGAENIKLNVNSNSRRQHNPCLKFDY